MPGKLKILIILAIVLRLLLLLFVLEDLKMNPDEEQNYEIAANNQAGKGYVWLFPDKADYAVTAFHGSFPVYMYEFLIRNNIPKEAWVVVFTLLFAVLYGISVYYFYLLAKSVGGMDHQAFYAALAYSLYPSIVFYIGTLFFYENFVVPLSVIIIYKLYVGLKAGFKKVDYILIPAGIVISCLFRPQVLVIYAFVMGTFVLLAFHSKKTRLLLIPLLTLVLLTISHVPLLEKNRKLWGEYVLGTQTGFELLQGHNPAAKGSWVNNWRDSTSSIYRYAHTQIAGIDTLNELQESQARKKLALEWISNNPVGELKLIVRKILIYFTPNNYPVLVTSGFMNPLNVLTHILFIAGLFIMLKSGKLSALQWLSLAPIAGSVVLSLVFFVGHRWRYYAEPFMILIAMQTLALLLKGRLKSAGSASVPRGE